MMTIILKNDTSYSHNMIINLDNVESIDDEIPATINFGDRQIGICKSIRKENDMLVADVELDDDWLFTDMVIRPTLKITKQHKLDRGEAQAHYL